MGRNCNCTLVATDPNRVCATMPLTLFRAMTQPVSFGTVEKGHFLDNPMEISYYCHKS